MEARTSRLDLLPPRGELASSYGPASGKSSNGARALLYGEVNGSDPPTVLFWRGRCRREPGAVSPTSRSRFRPATAVAAAPLWLAQEQAWHECEARSLKMALWRSHCLPLHVVEMEAPGQPPQVPQCGAECAAFGRLGRQRQLEGGQSPSGGLLLRPLSSLGQPSRAETLKRTCPPEPIGAMPTCGRCPSQERGVSSTHVPHRKWPNVGRSPLFGDL